MHGLLIEIIHFNWLSTLKDVVELLSTAIVDILAIAAYIKASNKYFRKEITGFQAIFLTNEQVYFGKITDSNNGYITMEDIYYLQTTTTQLHDMIAFDAALNAGSLGLVRLGG